MMLENSEIEKIKSAADLPKVMADEGITLTKAGVAYKCCCPFHNEKTPSFYVSNKKGTWTWKCFGSCGEGGDVISFIQKLKGFDFMESCRYLAQKFGIELHERERTQEDLDNEKRRESIFNALSEAQRYFAENKVEQAIEYLKGRGVADDTLRLYGTGISATSNVLTQHLLKLGYSEDTLKAANLSVWNEGKHELQDVFRARITFPFYDNYGRVIGFTGRTYLDKESQDKYHVAKYKNTGDTQLYTKGKNLFGLYQARKSISQLDKVIGVEGQFDAISCYNAGLHNVVALSGTALTDDQKQILWRLTHNITLMLDGDDAGVKHTREHVTALLQYGFNVTCVLLPNGMDPDEFIKVCAQESFPIYVSNRTISWVDYYVKTLGLQNPDGTFTEDATLMAKGINSILENIAIIQDNIMREQLIKKLSKLTGVDVRELKTSFKGLKNAKILKGDMSTPHIEGIEESKELINDENDVLELTTSMEQFIQDFQNKPIILSVGKPQDSDIQIVRTVTNNLKMILPSENVNRNRENEDIITLKAFYKNGFNTIVEDAQKEEDFITWYVGLYSAKISDEDISERDKDTYLDRVSEVIAYAPQAKRVRRMGEWSRSLGVTEKVMKDIIKQTLDKVSPKKKNSENEDNFDFQDSNNQRVPDYVTENPEYKNMLDRFHFYPRLKKNGEPGCYMFRSEDGESYRRVCDFFIEPLIHIYDKNPDANKRIVRLHSINKNRNGMPIKPKYAEWTTDTFASFSEIKKALKREGPYNLENMNRGAEWETIETWLSLQFKEAFRLNTLGQQQEGFFAFSNAILAPYKETPNNKENEVYGQYEIEKMDNLGTVEFNHNTYYCPAFSEIYINDRTDDDPYEQDKWLFYQDVPQNKRVSFAYWAKLFDEVYKINNNGKWGLLFIFLSAFRSNIFSKLGKFTALFFTGQTSSGKSQIGESCRSLWIKTGTNISNLNQISEAAFFSILERFRDIPWLFDEYNDKTLSEEKFQGLKALVYDGNTKQKRRSATGNDIVSTKVNTSIILLGQEAPQRDDNALANRVILCDVPSHTFTKEEVKIFQELKALERGGLSYLLCQVLQIRDIVDQKFITYQKEEKDKLTDSIKVDGARAGDLTRIIETVSYFVAMCRLIETDCTWLKLPFTYDGFFHIAEEKVKNQVGLLGQTDKVSSFFSAMENMLDRKVVIFGREYNIQPAADTIIAVDNNEINVGMGHKIMYLNVKATHDLYRKDRISDEPISRQTLIGYLKSNPAFLGTKKSYRFSWMEPTMGAVDANGNTVEDGARAGMMMEKKTKINSCFVFDYEKLSKDMDIDLLRDYLGDVDEPKENLDDVPF